MKKYLLFFLLFVLCIGLEGQIISKKECVDTLHQIPIYDPYCWMEDINSKDVINYIESENRNTDEAKKKLKRLYKDYLEEEKSYKVGSSKKTFLMEKPEGNYIYYPRRKGLSMLMCRKKRDDHSKEEIVLDMKKAVNNLRNYEVMMFRVTPDGERLGYIVANEEISDAILRIKKINTPHDYTEELANVMNFVWMNDSVILYTQYDKKNDVTSKIFKHKSGTPQSSDILLFEEMEKQNMVDVILSDSKQFAFVEIFHNLYSEYYYMDIHKNGTLKLIESRKHGHRYKPDHYSGDSVFYILTNKDAPNNKIVTTKIHQPSSEYWADFINESSSRIDRLKFFSNYLVYEERKDGCIGLTLTDKKTKKREPIGFDEKAYAIKLVYIDTLMNRIRLKFCSYITPDTYYDYDIQTRQLIMLYETKIKNYQKENYKVDVVHATTHDGFTIPVTIVYHKDTPRDGSAPAWMNVYGAYGLTYDPGFTQTALPLLNRGFYWIRADVRGGGGLASRWHVDGTTINKKNSIYDVASIINRLINKKYTSAGKVHLTGNSEGGLVLGMAANMYPDLFGSITLQVPKLDVLHEKDQKEWLEVGNPNIKEEFDYILTYSPYQNVKKHAYPAMLFITGFHDVNVPCYQSLKMVARLRKENTGKAPIFLNVDMNGNHYRINWKKAFHPHIFKVAVHQNLL